MVRSAVALEQHLLKPQSSMHAWSPSQCRAAPIASPGKSPQEPGSHAHGSFNSKLNCKTSWPASLPIGADGSLNSTSAHARIHAYLAFNPRIRTTLMVSSLRTEVEYDHVHAPIVCSYTDRLIVKEQIRHSNPPRHRSRPGPQGQGFKVVRAWVLGLGFRMVEQLPSVPGSARSTWADRRFRVQLKI